jgi:hypothetical protein
MVCSIKIYLEYVKNDLDYFGSQGLGVADISTFRSEMSEAARLEMVEELGWDTRFRGGAASLPPGVLAS